MSNKNTTDKSPVTIEQKKQYFIQQAKLERQKKEAEKKVMDQEFDEAVGGKNVVLPIKHN
jgi:hypothetical protein